MQARSAPKQAVPVMFHAQDYRRIIAMYLQVVLADLIPLVILLQPSQVDAAALHLAHRRALAAPTTVVGRVVTEIWLRWAGLH